MGLSVLLTSQRFAGACRLPFVVGALVIDHAVELIENIVGRN